MNVPDGNEGVLLNEKAKGKIIDSPFIFGLLEVSVESLLELPLVSYLVDEKDWIR